MNPAITHRHVIVRLLNGPIYQEDLDLWGRLGAEWDKTVSYTHLTLPTNREV